MVPDPASECCTPTAYRVEGGVPLNGTIPISGAKNAVLKLMVPVKRYPDSVPSAFVLFTARQL